jgi:antirestriction protein ArdC
MNVYEIVTNQILERMQQTGEIPWRKPWTTSAPRNLISGKDYRGINVFMLGASGYPRPEWLTFNQANKIGARVNAGERSNLVVFWHIGNEKEYTKKDGTKKLGKSFLLRYSRVFNVTQCSHGDQTLVAKLGLDSKTGPAVNTIEACERLVADMQNRPAIKAADAAWYRPSTDEIGIPTRDTFHSSEAYYATLFHEMTHSTGHASRVGRDGIEVLNSFGSEAYSKEELIAEMGSAMLCGATGIAPAVLDNSVAYLKNWMRVLKGDSKLIVTAASAAQKAADYIRGTSATVDADA